jgi:hypothetical protein
MRKAKLPNLNGPFTREENERIDVEYPNESPAERWRLLQAQRLLDWSEQQRMRKSNIQVTKPRR